MSAGRIEVPFKAEEVKGHRHDFLNCPAFRLLPDELQKRVRKEAHLGRYLHILPMREYGPPKFFPQLSRKMRGMKNPNLLYPVGEGVYIHIYPDPNDIRDYYIPVEPSTLLDLAPLMERIERRMVEFVSELEAATSPEHRRQVILDLLDRIVEVVDEEAPSEEAGDEEEGEGERGAREGKRGLLRLFGRGRKERIRLTRAQYEGIRYLLVRNINGLGVLEPLILDPYIEDISCSGMGPVFVEHKIFGSLKSTVVFETSQELDQFVIQMSEKMGRPVSFREPVVDAELPDGSRINIVFGSDVSKRGSNFTIRKFATTPMSVLELIETGSINYEIAAYLWLCLQDGMNAWVSGETASGKTTLMNALTTFVPPNAKIVSIEETPEIQVPHPNWIRGLTRGASKNAQASAVTMFDLLKAALRQRPNLIIVGEIRGEEGAIAFQAMQTGHAVMSTFHASTVERLIQRLTGNPINVPITYLDNLNLVILQSAVRLPNGSIGRRCIAIAELIGYDPSSDAVNYIEVFRWDPTTDTFHFRGHFNSYLLEEKIAPRRGLPPQRKREIYSELERRALILQKIHKQGVTNFYALYNVIAKAYREGIIR